MSPRISTRLLATQSDQRLLELARRGHERAFEAVVHRYRRPLLRYCARMGLSDGGAEDVLQHALLQAWLALRRQAEVRELRPWLYRIVHNTAVNALRSSRQDQVPLPDGAAGLAAPAVESNVERRIALRDALSGVAALPQMQREAIVLSAFGGSSHEEVADVLGVTDGAVRGLLYRARATLRGAAAAITPQPLISWACGAGGAAPPAERLAELSAPVGVAGLTGVLAKGAAMAVTAAVVVGGPSVVNPGQRAHHRPTGASPSSRASSHLVASAAPQTATGGQFRSVERLTPVSFTRTHAVHSRGRNGAQGGRRSDENGGSGHDGRSPAFSLSTSPTDARHTGRTDGSGDHMESVSPEEAPSRERSDAGLRSGSPATERDGARASAPAQPPRDDLRPEDEGAPTPGARHGSDGSTGSEQTKTAPTPSTTLVPPSPATAPLRD